MIFKLYRINMEEKKCEICKGKATNICFECSFYLCDDCFDFIHKKNVNSHHKKEDIVPFISFDLKCLEHPKIPMNLFSKEEKCKIYIFNFFINMIVLLCPLCFFNSEHNKEHHIIDINKK